MKKGETAVAWQVPIKFFSSRSTLSKGSIITIYLQIKLLKCSPLVTSQQDCSIRLNSFASAATIRHYQLPAKTTQFRLNRFSQTCSCFREFKEKKKKEQKRKKNRLPACYFSIVFDCFLNFLVRFFVRKNFWFLSQIQFPVTNSHYNSRNYSRI